MDRLSEDQLSILKACRIFRISFAVACRVAWRGVGGGGSDRHRVAEYDAAQVWAAIHERSPLLAQCGMQLALQRAEMPRTRALDAILMMNPGLSSAPAPGRTASATSISTRRRLATRRTGGPSTWATYPSPRLASCGTGPTASWGVASLSRMRAPRPTKKGPAGLPQEGGAAVPAATVRIVLEVLRSERF